MRLFLFLLLLMAGKAIAQEAPLLQINGSTVLQWQAPTQNVDGSPLTDLAAYRVYWGLQARNYTGQIEIPDDALTSWTLQFDALDPANLSWFFAMTALDADGNESAYSNEVRKDVTFTIIDNRPPMPPVLQSVEMNLTCTTNNTFITCEVSVQ